MVRFVFQPWRALQNTSQRHASRILRARQAAWRWDFLLGCKMIKARLTEYKGVRFRSKSEAIFARYLHLEAEERDSIKAFQNKERGWNVIYSPSTHIEYEPQVEIKGWMPDFLVARCHYFYDRSSKADFRKNSIWSYTYIEYKPVRPTDAYLENWLSITEKIEAAPEGLTPRSLISCTLFYGSPFSLSQRGCLFPRSRDGVLNIVENDDDWVAYFPELMDYRFDLPNGGG